MFFFFLITKRQTVTRENKSENAFCARWVFFWCNTLNDHWRNRIESPLSSADNKSIALPLGSLRVEALNEQHHDGRRALIWSVGAVSFWKPCGESRVERFWECCRPFEWTFQTAGHDSRPFVDHWLISSLFLGVCVPSLTLCGWLRFPVSHDAHAGTWKTISASGFAVCFLFFCLSDEEIIPVGKRGRIWCVRFLCVCLWGCVCFFFFLPHVR